MSTLSWIKEHHTPVSRLCSVSRHRQMVPRHRCSKFSRQAFTVAGPMVWNSLPSTLDLETRQSVLITLQSQWRRGCLEDTVVLSGLEVFHNDALM